MKNSMQPGIQKGGRTCEVESRSRTVTVPCREPASMQSLSTVIAKGMPSSSVLAYLLPIVVPAATVHTI